jgi:hypothetical protein
MGWRVGWGERQQRGEGLKKGSWKARPFVSPLFDPSFLEIKFAGVSEEVVREDEARGSGPFEVGGLVEEEERRSKVRVSRYCTDQWGAIVRYGMDAVASRVVVWDLGCAVRSPRDNTCVWQAYEGIGAPCSQAFAGRRSTSPTGPTLNLGNLGGAKPASRGS